MNRIDKVRQKLTENNLDAILISTPANIFYLTNFPFLVSTDREGFLLVTQTAQYIISSPLYKDEFITKAPTFTFLEISSVLHTTVSEHIQQVMRVAGLSRLAFEGSNLTHNEYIKLAEIPGLVLENEDIDDMREIKDVEEIASIQKACNISDSVFEKTLTIIKHGITEKEVAMFMESEIKKQGGELAFPTIVAFGPNAATPHHNTDETQLMENQFILFDFGAKYHEYCSDLSRTIYFGTPSEQEIAYYNAVKTSQEKAIDYARTASPVIGGQIEEQARNYLRSLNLEPFMHSGHGMGLYDHELPSIRPASQEIITENMVFTIEPGFYISGQLGIRIEDDIVKTKDGIEILTHAPKELIIKA